MIFKKNTNTKGKEDKIYIKERMLGASELSASEIAMSHD